MAKKSDLSAIIPAELFDESTVEKGILNPLFDLLSFRIKIDKIGNNYTCAINLDDLYKRTDGGLNLKLNIYYEKFTDDLDIILYDQKTVAISTSPFLSGYIQIFHSPNGKNFTILNMIQCLEEVTLACFKIVATDPSIYEFPISLLFLSIQQMNNKSLGIVWI